MLRAFSLASISPVEFAKTEGRESGATQTTREREERSQRPVAPLGALARAPLRDGVAPRASGCAGAQKLQEVHPPPPCALATSVPSAHVDVAPANAHVHADRPAPSVARCHRRRAQLCGHSDDRPVQALHGDHRAQWRGQEQPHGRHLFRPGRCAHSPKAPPLSARARLVPPPCGPVARRCISATAPSQTNHTHAHAGARCAPHPPAGSQTPHRPRAPAQ